MNKYEESPDKYWETFENEIKELRNRLLKGPDGVELYGQFADFRDALQKKYPDNYHKYVAYHALIGSTLDPDEKAPELDFPEPDSVKSYLENLLKEQEASD